MMQWMVAVVVGVKRDSSIVEQKLNKSYSESDGAWQN